MKRLIYVTIVLLLSLAACIKYDDSSIRKELGELEHRVEKLEELCMQLNTNIASLRTLVDVLQKGDYITSVTPVQQGNTVIGYTITFAKNTPITIYNGTGEGSGGYPHIGIKKGSDGVYYWTLNGEWLYDDNGNKIRAEGVTPQLKIEDGYWWVSYDKGSTWEKSGAATSGGTGGGDCIITDVDQTEIDVTFTLSDGTQITVPKTQPYSDEDFIAFKDNNVKLICVTNWDKNEDGELSYAEAADVKSIGTKFAGSSIVSFGELYHFVSLERLDVGAFKECKSLSAITLPDGIKTIAEEAFYACQNISQIALTEVLTDIGNNAFALCASLQSVTIPRSVVNMGDGVFASCQQLASFGGEYASADGRSIIIDGVLKAFAPYENVTYVLPEGVTAIGTGAFTGAKLLSDITLPKNLVEVRESAVADCESLSVITFTGVVPPAMHEQAFVSCAKDLTYYVPDQALGDYLHSEWAPIHKERISASFEPNAYTIVYRTNNNTQLTLKEDAFDAKVVKHVYNNGQGAIVFDSALSTIGNNAFSSYSNLTSITIPEKVTTIGDYAFNYCYSLGNVILPEGLESIGNSAFGDCTSFSSVTIPSSVTFLGSGIYYNCKGSLTVNCNIEDSNSYSSSPFARASFSKVTVAEGVTHVGKYAFYGNSALTSIILPESLLAIGDQAFYRSGLANITIPDGVLTVGNEAFYYCQSLLKAKVGRGISTLPRSVFHGCGYMTSVELSEGLLKIDQSAFYDCNSLLKVTIPDSVTEIASSAFQRCYKLMQLNFGSGLQTIGSSAFCDCRSLLTLDIPEGVTTIQQEAFAYCTALVSTTIPSTITNIDPSSFLYCTGTATIKFNIPDGSYNSPRLSSTFSKIIFSEDVTMIGAYALRGIESLMSIELPSSLVSIGEGSFYNCISLQSVVIPDSVMIIGRSAFYGCTSLATATLGSGVSTLPSNLFANCTSLKSFTIPDTVYKMESGVFDGCTSLTTADITTNITRIEDYTFRNCPMMKNVVLHKDINYIGSNVFVGCGGKLTINCNVLNSNTSETTGKFADAKFTEVVISDDVTIIGNYTFYNCDNLRTITIPDNVVSLGQGAMSKCDMLQSATIGKGVEVINRNMFSECKMLSDFTIPDHVTSIGEYAFAQTALKSVTIPDSVTLVGEYLFNGCTSLTSATIGAGTTNLTRYMFAGCSALKTVVIPENVTTIKDGVFSSCMSLSEISLPAGLTSLGGSVFLDCESLLSLVVPDGVNSIYNRAFNGCHNMVSLTLGSGVTSIYPDALDCDNLSKLFCKATTPPYFSTGSNWNGLSYLTSSCNIYVPSESVELYKAAQYWGTRADMIFGYDFE